MEAILILAGLLLAVVGVLFDRHRDQDGSPGETAGGVGAGSGEPSAPEDPGHAAGIDLSDDLHAHRTCINPATGLPMISDSEVGFDVGGNPYGFSNDDLSTHHDSFGSIFDSSSDSDSAFGSFDSDDWS